MARYWITISRMCLTSSIAFIAQLGAMAQLAPVVFMQGQGNFSIPLLVTPSVSGGSQVSASSSSSAFVNNQGAGASANATVTTPNGTTSTSQSVFTPGATSSGASATASGSSVGVGTVSATVNTTGPGGGFTTGIPATSSPVPNIGVGVGINNSVSASSGSNSASSSPMLAPVIPPSPSATFIPTFSTPTGSQAVAVGHQQVIEKTQQSTSVTYQVVGLPSRVFPGLGLRWVPVNANE